MEAWCDLNVPLWEKEQEKGNIRLVWRDIYRNEERKRGRESKEMAVLYKGEQVKLWKGLNCDITRNKEGK